MRGKVRVPTPPNPDMDLWPRIKQAIESTSVSRADVMVNLPTCHLKKCRGDHGDVDTVFRIFAERIAESVHTELLCKATSEPDDLGSEDE